MMKLSSNILIALVGLNLFNGCSSISREPSSIQDSCSEIVGKVLAVKSTAIVGFTENEAKTRALAIIRKKYPHFSQNQASKHFDFLKSSCL